MILFEVGRCPTPRDIYGRDLNRVWIIRKRGSISATPLLSRHGYRRPRLHRG